VFDEYVTSGHISGSEATTAFMNGASPSHLQKNLNESSKMGNGLIHKSNLSRVANQGQTFRNNNRSSVTNSNSKNYDKKAQDNIRMAKFKKIDWEAVHSNIFKGPSKN
jgi:hypothetical protein